MALEGALKLKEISYIHAEGYPAAEMKHGPIALIDENMPIVFIAPKDSVYDKVVNNIEEVINEGYQNKNDFAELHDVDVFTVNKWVNDGYLYFDMGDTVSIIKVIKHYDVPK